MPSASLLVVFVLAGGMGFVVALLSLYVDLVLEPDPGYEQSNRVATAGQSTDTGLFGLPYEIVERLDEEMTSIEAAAVSQARPILVGPQREETVMHAVSAEFFAGLRPRVALGRGLRVEDHAPDAEPVLVLTHRYWQRRFGGDRNILGTFLEVTRDPAVPYSVPFGWDGPTEPEQETTRFRIVGVLADTFAGIPAPEGLLVTETPFLAPLERVYPLIFGVSDSLRGSIGFAVFVRRASSVSTTAMLSELRAYVESRDFPLLPDARIDAIDGIVSNISVQREAKRQLEMLLAASLLLALVATANVSLLLLARAPGRRRELGIRMAVGAPLKRLARQLATEAGLLVVVSAGLGLVLSIWFGAYMQSLPLLRDAEWRNVTLLDWRVLSLSCVLVLALTMLVSLAPMLSVKRLSIATLSRQATARASSTQRLAGTVQIAAAGAFGAAAIAFGWHVGGLVFGDAGYETDGRHVVSLRSDFANPTIRVTRLREAVEAIPGVSAVAFGHPVPGDDFVSTVRTRYPNDPSNTLVVYRGSVDSRFIDLLGFRLLHGRAPDVDESGFVVVVNQSLARAFWGREDVVGERLSGAVRWGSGGSEVIGVLEDVSFGHPSAPVAPTAFLPLTTSGSISRAVVEAQLTAAQLRQALDRLAADGTLEIEVADVQPLKAVRNELIAADRARGFLIFATAIVVILSATFGYYGMQRYLVAAGRREYAIRASLGAGPKALARSVLRGGLLLGLPGLVTGGLLAFLVVAWLRDGFVSAEVSPAPVMVGVIAGLAVLLVAATLGPARAAKRTQPGTLLREE